MARFYNNKGILDPTSPNQLKKVGPLLQKFLDQRMLYFSKAKSELNYIFEVMEIEYQSREFGTYRIYEFSEGSGESAHSRNCCLDEQNERLRAF